MGVNDMNGPKTLRWMSQDIPFRQGESVAAALEAAGITSFGRDAVDRETRYFCGIGACQCCLVSINGVATEACLTPAWDGMVIVGLEVDLD
ncbi:2Fe-2S iron-sulfur cluster-binding protein [Ensifer sp. Root142]|uniref:2Fe-2S iron-sulfur cluster-binding protein n=2 Tax=unclassified Ensifer TaxID=2633371 RepID=UPI001FCDD993|nr:2Fe-2S iron-sulfur cluster-binding protein [Ensifer sp. Root142]MDP9632745.1 aerobic-type carbon monoxide dehydrogenase small subunit (CoxS/CutS family) [Ensifer adhaerens]